MNTSNFVVPRDSCDSPYRNLLNTIILDTNKLFETFNQNGSLVLNRVRSDHVHSQLFMFVIMIHNLV